MIRPRHVFAVSALLVVLLAVVASPAHAQYGRPMMSEPAMGEKYRVEAVLNLWNPSLDAVISSDREHSDLVALLVEVGTTTASGESPPAEWPRWTEVVANIGRLAGVTVPAMSECQVLVLSDSWDDLEVAFRFGSILVWYHWWTTA